MLVLGSCAAQALEFTEPPVEPRLTDLNASKQTDTSAFLDQLLWISGIPRSVLPPGIHGPQAQKEDCTILPEEVGRGMTL